MPPCTQEKCQEVLWSAQECPGAARSAQKHPKAPRGALKCSQAPRSAQKRPGAPRAAQKRPGAPWSALGRAAPRSFNNPQGPPGVPERLIKGGAKVLSGAPLAHTARLNHEPDKQPPLPRASARHIWEMFVRPFWADDPTQKGLANNPKKYKSEDQKVLL